MISGEINPVGVEELDVTQRVEWKTVQQRSCIYVGSVEIAIVDQKLTQEKEQDWERFAASFVQAFENNKENVL